MTTVRIGTRGSALARWQADWVSDQLKSQGVGVEIVFITTVGDATSGPIGQIGGQGIFTKEVQRAVLDREVDLAVHSLKDLPTDSVSGLELSAVPVRASSSDVLVSAVSDGWQSLPEGARVGTGSVRRQAQLLAARPDLQVLGIRGNVDTRLRKLDDGEYDAILLAEAGLRRLGLGERITEVLTHDLMLPAVGQGALGIETRVDDELTHQVLEPLDDAETRACTAAERSLLRSLHGGCSAPIGAAAQIVDQQLQLSAVVLSPDGSTRLTAQQHAERENAEELGRSVALSLFEQGAERLLQSARDS